MIRLLCLLVLFCLSGALLAQFVNPDPGYVFDNSEVPLIRIEIDEDSLNYILDDANLESNREFQAKFYFKKKGSIDTIERVGFRLRGNTSREAEKKSFKVSFNSFERGKKFKGLEKLNLNGEHNDPTVCRSKLSWDLAALMDIPCTRSNHVQLYINNKYFGLYLNVEHIDEEFIQKRFQQDFGNLYKCLYPADLNYKSANPNAYKEFIFGRRAYELKTNKEEDDYSDLANFIDVLNNTAIDELPCELEKVFDVDNYLKVIVLDVLISNWDGPIINKNNFYLYFNPATKKFSYIPYDLDNTYGIDWFGINWPITDIYEWSSISGEYRPLYERIMEVKSYRDRVSCYFRKYLKLYFNTDFISPYLEEKFESLIPFRAIDAYASYDYGWTFDEFEYSFDAGVGQHVPYGLNEYVSIRKNTAENQIEDFELLPFIEKVQVDRSPGAIDFQVSFVNSALLGVLEIHYSINGSDFEEQVIRENNELYQFQYLIEESGTMNYKLVYTDRTGNQYSWPSCDYYSLVLGARPSSAVVINELMASNLDWVADASGLFDDWIELYNNEDTIVPLEGKYLSDDRNKPNKWKLPSYDLEPDSYLIVWADKDEEEGAFHANFKLSKEGEFIGLFDTKQNDLNPIDTLVFPPLEENQSYGRLPNGIGPFQLLPRVSFNAFNHDGTANKEYKNALPVAYPNPTQGQLFLSNLKAVNNRIKLWDSSGNLIASWDSHLDLNLGHFPAGLYNLQIISENGSSNISVIKLD